MLEFDSVALPLGVALTLSLLVERIVQVMKNLLDVLPIGAGKYAMLTKAQLRRDTAEFEKLLARHAQDDARRAEEAEFKGLRQKRKELTARLRPDAPPDDPQRVELANVIARMEELEKNEGWNEQSPPGLVVVEPPKEPDRGNSIRTLIIQLLATATGIVVAHYSNLTLFTSLLGPGVGLARELDFLLSGLALGCGSAPMHLVVQFIGARNVPLAVTSAVEDAAEEQAAAPPVSQPLVRSAPSTAAVPALVTSPGLDDWIDIPYTGGLAREALEGIHRRPKDPTLIVYHHTAMQNTATMDDLARVIKSRGWVTAYNCVILGDGSINALCRWDRFGSHAVGHNMESLGLSFMGNFETNPKVPFSNPDGRFGPTHPTEAQLHAGARVITLWSFLYDIDIDTDAAFDANVIPHNRISTKTCPGNNFPYAEFRDMIRVYRRLWKESSAIKARIREFDLKPFVHHSRPQDNAA